MAPEIKFTKVDYFTFLHYNYFAAIVQLLHNTCVYIFLTAVHQWRIC